MKQAWRSVGLIAVAIVMTGCTDVMDTTSFGGPGGALGLRAGSEEGDILLGGPFDLAVYSATDLETLEVMLIAGTEENPTQAVHIQMFWRPRAGKTPFDPSATNASVNYVVFEGEQAGVYGGGGMLRLGDRPGEPRFSGTLRNATLRLLDASEGFQPGQVGRRTVAAGGFTAQRDDQRTLELTRKISILLEQRLGYPRMVEAR